MRLRSVLLFECAVSSDAQDQALQLRFSPQLENVPEEPHGPRWRPPASLAQALGEAAPAALRLLQPVQDELAGVDEALHTVHQTHLGPRVQLRARLVHALLPADLCHLVHELLKTLLL